MKTKEKKDVNSDDAKDEDGEKCSKPEPKPPPIPTLSFESFSGAKVKKGPALDEIKKDFYKKNNNP